MAVLVMKMILFNIYELNFERNLINYFILYLLSVVFNLKAPLIISSNEIIMKYFGKKLIKHIIFKGARLRKLILSVY